MWCLLIDAHTIVENGYLERVSNAARHDADVPGVGAPRDAVTDGIFDEVLKCESREDGWPEGRIDLVCDAQPIREPGLFDREVLFDELELLVECHLVGAMSAQRATEHVTELLDDPGGSPPFTVPHQHGNRVQRVEEEVRVELRGQRGEPCARELRRESRVLDLLFARFDEEPDAMLDSDDSQVHRHAKWQRDEEPADEIHERPAIECLGHQHRSQHSADSCPCHAEEQGNRQVKERMACQMGPGERPSS